MLSWSIAIIWLAILLILEPQSNTWLHNNFNTTSFYNTKIHCFLLFYLIQYLLLCSFWYLVTRFCNNVQVAFQDIVPDSQTQPKNLNNVFLFKTYRKQFFYCWKKKKGGWPLNLGLGPQRVCQSTPFAMLSSILVSKIIKSI